MGRADHRRDEDQGSRMGALVFSPELEILCDKGVAEAIDQTENQIKRGKCGKRWDMGVKIFFLLRERDSTGQNVREQI